MGLKSGSRESGLDDTDGETDDTQTEAETEKPESENSIAETGQRPEDSASVTEDASESDPQDGTGETESTGAPSVDSIPYKLRRSRVNEGREQVPYFLRPEVIDAEDQLRETLEAELGETVYKSDYREAAMVVAQHRPDLVAEVLREWGYDFGNG